MSDWLLARTWRFRWQARLAARIIGVLDSLDGLAARISRKPWGVYDHPDGVHVIPVRDAVDHAFDGECICGPSVDFIDPDTGETWPGHRPRVVHHSLDGREANE